MRSMPAVIDSVPDALLAVAGDGPEREALAALAAQLGVSERVRWLGLLPHPDVFRFLRAVDAFAMPSRYEGFGLAAVEAMAAGLPVVASKVDGLEEVVDHGCTGFLVPTEESEPLSRAIVNLLSDPARARPMGLAGRKRVESLFSMASYETSVLAVYRGLR